MGNPIWFGAPLVVTAIQGLIDAADEQLNGQDKQRATSDTESDSNKVRSRQRVRHGNPWTLLLLRMQDYLIFLFVNQDPSTNEFCCVSPNHNELK